MARWIALIKKNKLSSVLSLNSKIILIPFIFVISSCFLWMVVLFRPDVGIHSGHVELDGVHFPASLDDVKKLFSILMIYKEVHWSYVIFLFSSGYIYKQTFAIPGSVLLNVLAGAIFGCWPFGIFLCSFLTACGSSNCFLLSKYAGKDLIKKKFPAQIIWLQDKLIENEGQLLCFLISLRLFPASPNWLINIVAPIVGIPLPLFFLSVLIGLLPYNFLCLKAGEALSEIQSIDEIFTLRRLLMMLGSALFIFMISRVTNKQKPIGCRASRDVRGGGHSVGAGGRSEKDDQHPHQT